MRNAPATVFLAILALCAALGQAQESKGDTRTAPSVFQAPRERPEDVRIAEEASRLLADNGASFSAPAFVSVYYLDSEKRLYDDTQRILSVEYRSRARGGAYADPALHTPADWRDSYEYDAQGRLLGWTRTRGDARESFTAEGALVTKKDDAGRPLEARSVRYTTKPMGANTAPCLEYQPGGELLKYAYESADDRRGKVTSRERL